MRLPRIFSEAKTTPIPARAPGQRSVGVAYADAMNSCDFLRLYGTSRAREHANGKNHRVQFVIITDVNANRCRGLHRSRTTVNAMVPPVQLRRGDQAPAATAGKV